MTKKLPKIIEPELLNGNAESHEAWHAFEIMAEFVGATEKLKEITPAVSIFGSARTPPDHPYYLLTQDIARQLSDTTHPGPCQPSYAVVGISAPTVQARAETADTKLSFRGDANGSARRGPMESNRNRQWPNAH